MLQPQQLLGFILLASGVLWYAFNWYRKKTSIQNLSTDTDPDAWITFKPTPEQVEFLQSYLQYIERTSPNADSPIWWNYAKEGLSIPKIAQKEAALAANPTSRKAKDSDEK